jgi:hypothetical protein
MRAPLGDIVVFYLGPEPRLTPEQALAFADQLRALAADGQPPVEEHQAARPAVLAGP